MFQATNISTAAKVGRGTRAASGAATSTISNSTEACTMPATGLLAPLLMLVTVRAMVPVAGMPPKNGVMKLAVPCAISSWFGSCRSSVMPSATRAHSSDSMAPRIASVRAGMNRKRAVSQLSSGRAKAGSSAGMPPKRLPIVSTGRPSVDTAMLPRISATMEPGMMVSLPCRTCLFGPSEGSRCCQAMMTSSEPADTASA